MNEMSTGCGGCGLQPVLVSYPYTRGSLYRCDCCNQMHQPNTAQYPSAGSMVENAYMVFNNKPYILDNTTTNYGVKLNVSENIYTRFSKRNDPSCINMVATFDMTSDQIITNSVWAAFLEDFITNEYDSLEGVLPIQKSEVFFRIHFHFEDENKGVVYTSYVDSTVKEHLLHYTDINDYFVTSFKNIAVTIIPQLDYNGIYSLIIDRVEARVNVIDTKQHYTDKSNPYYQWINNNTKVLIQHDTITAGESDGSLIIAILEVNHAMAVQLNVATRLKIAFTAYMSNTIVVGNSFGVYKALFNTSGQEITDLKNRIAVIESNLTDLTASISELTSTVTGLTTSIETLTTSIEGIQTSISSLDERVTALEEKNNASDDPDNG